MVYGIDGKANISRNCSFCTSRDLSVGLSGELQSAPMAGIVLGLFANQTNVRVGNPSAMMPTIPDSLEHAEISLPTAILNTPDVFKFLTESSNRGGNWGKKVTAVQTMFNILSFEPRAFIHRSSRALSYSRLRE